MSKASDDEYSEMDKLIDKEMNSSRMSPIQRKIYVSQNRMAYVGIFFVIIFVIITLALSVTFLPALTKILWIASKIEISNSTISIVDDYTFEAKNIVIESGGGISYIDPWRLTATLDVFTFSILDNVFTPSYLTPVFTIANNGSVAFRQLNALNLVITGNSILNTLTVAQLNVTGTSTLGTLNILNSLTVVGNVNITGNLFLTGNITTFNIINVITSINATDAILNGALIVYGKSTLSNTNINGIVNVTGAIYLNGVALSTSGGGIGGSCNGSCTVNGTMIAPSQILMGPLTISNTATNTIFSFQGNNLYYNLNPSSAWRILGGGSGSMGSGSAFMASGLSGFTVASPGGPIGFSSSGFSYSYTSLTQNTAFTGLSGASFLVTAYDTVHFGATTQVFLGTAVNSIQITTTAGDYGINLNGNTLITGDVGYTGTLSSLSSQVCKANFTALSSNSVAYDVIMSITPGLFNWVPNCQPNNTVLKTLPDVGFISEQVYNATKNLPIDSLIVPTTLTTRDNQTLAVNNLDYMSLYSYGIGHMQNQTNYLNNAYAMIAQLSAVIQQMNTTINLLLNATRT